MILSFCIPTYNRLKFLRKNIDILLKQIHEENLADKVEICISDNHATDGTEDYCRNLLTNTNGIKVSYNRNEENLGPDRNFLSAMHMASGEYSILWGDDDFLHERGLRRIFELISHGKTNDIQILVSSTNIIDVNGSPMFVKNFLRNDIKEYTVDFSKPEEARSYFFLLKDMGGLLSFISDVIYKTSIINEIEFDDRFIGTHYAFLCYWWGYLAKGKKLYYSSIPFLDETYQYQPAYGFGVKRLLIDYYGYMLIAQVLFHIDSSIIKEDFLDAFQSLHPLIKHQLVLAAEKKNYTLQIRNRLLDCGVSSKEVEFLYYSVSLKSLIKMLVYVIFPEKIIFRLKSIKGR